MIGLDTNVLIRYLVQDEPRQSAKATGLMHSLTAEKPGYITQIVLAETVWVLTRSYHADRHQIARIIDTLLQTREVLVENANIVRQALHIFRSSKAAFADCLIERACHDAHCNDTATFDIAAAKTAGMRLIS